MLEDEGLVIGAVEGITGLAWTEVTITGRASHAGTTPMNLRRDAACAASEVALFVRRLAQEMGGHQKGTVGRLALYPNLINVVAERATLTVDLRNTQEAPCAPPSRSSRASSTASPRANRSRSRRAASGASRRWRFPTRWCRWSRRRRATSRSSAACPRAPATTRR